jgi:hypothetical protein
VFRQVARGQTGRGVVGHEGTQVRSDADRLGGWARLTGRDDAPNALGVSCLVERQERGESNAGARGDQPDARGVPSRDAKSKLKQGAVRARNFEANPLNGDRAVAAAIASSPPRGLRG